MITKELDFIPILLGNDINSYSMARAFHEEYQVKSIIIGKFRSGPNNNSQISDFIVIPKIETDTVFLQTMNLIAEKYTNKKLLLIGCGDSYVNLIINNKNYLKDKFVMPYIGDGLMNDLINKEKFYQICALYNIDYPRTFIYRKNTSPNYDLSFDFPVILKPANGIMYWQFPFTGQDKVFKLKNRQELDQTAKKIFDSGYSDSLIVQDFIPGDDSFMRVLTCYSDKNAEVKLMSLGHVLLEEHTPHGLGNHAVILSDYNEALTNKIKIFLERLGYVGLSNFDIKYDSRDGKFKVFEINLRQGRSNFYVTGSGDNLAKYIVEDYIRNNKLGYKVANTKNLWLVIPKMVALKYTKSQELKDTIISLAEQGKIINPLFYKGDLNVKRLAYLIKSHLSHFRKYYKYYR
jgi:D-aspartate ligase